MLWCYQHVCLLLNQNESILKPDLHVEVLIHIQNVLVPCCDVISMSACPVKPKWKHTKTWFTCWCVDTHTYVLVPCFDVISMSVCPVKPKWKHTKTWFTCWGVDLLGCNPSSKSISFQNGRIHCMEDIGP